MLYRQRNDPLKINDFQYVIVDTDAGGDDCQALILLDYYVKKQGKTLLGITCCNGNAYVEDVARNVLICQDVCGSRYPIYMGNDCNIAGESIKDNFFGKDGLGERQQKYLQTLKLDTNLIQKQKAYKFIAQSAVKYKGQIAMICIAPLSNLALAYHYENSLPQCFTNIIIMGGSDTLAGMHSFYTAEFNVGLDAQAAYVIFQKFKNIVEISFDTSCMSLPVAPMQKLFLSNRTPKADFIREIYEYQYKKPVPMPPSVVDGLAAIVLFNPSVVTSGQALRMSVIQRGHRTRGCTVVDYFSPLSQQPNLYLVKGFDVEKIIEEVERSYD